MSHRLEGLQREADNVERYLRQKVGLLGCDLEIIGALLFIKYQGEDKRIEELLKGTSELLEKGKKLIEELKLKNTNEW